MLSPATGERSPQREGEGRWIRVTFRFYLSLQGRRPHLAQGGDGRRNQRLTADISQEDVAFVHVDPAGKATADLRTVRGPAGRLTGIEFNTVPSAPGLFAYLRRQAERENQEDAARQQMAQHHAVRVRDAFFRTPAARAAGFGADGTVQIDAHSLPLDHAAFFEGPNAPTHLLDFDAEDPISFEARRRSLADALQQARQGAAEAAGRAALIAWVQRYGSVASRKDVQEQNWLACRVEFARAYRPEGYLLWPDLLAELGTQAQQVSMRMLAPMPDELSALERVGPMPELCSSPSLIWVTRSSRLDGRGVAETWCVIRLQLHTPDNNTVEIYRGVSVRAIAPVPAAPAGG
jgi:hypothetical protein